MLQPLDPGCAGLRGEATSSADAGVMEGLTVPTCVWVELVGAPSWDPARWVLPCSLAGAPDLPELAGRRPRKISRRVLGGEGPGFPELASGKALPCTPRLPISTSREPRASGIPESPVRRTQRAFWEAWLASSHSLLSPIERFSLQFTP